MMKPVHAIGVFHDQNGSICAIVAASDTIMIASPTHISFVPATAAVHLRFSCQA